MSNLNWQLVREHWDFDIQLFKEIIGEKKTLGRGGKKRIICESDYVSRKHCTIFYKNGVFYVEDLNSTNGTFLNGVKIVTRLERELRDGDLIGLGVANVEDCPTDQYFLFRFIKCESKRIVKKEMSKAKVQSRPIPVINLEDQDDEDEYDPADLQDEIYPSSSAMSNSIIPNHTVFKKPGNPTPRASAEISSSNEEPSDYLKSETVRSKPGPACSKLRLGFLTPESTSLKLKQEPGSSKLVAALSNLEDHFEPASKSSSMYLNEVQTPSRLSTHSSMRTESLHPEMTNGDNESMSLFKSNRTLSKEDKLKSVAEDSIQKKYINDKMAFGKNPNTIQQTTSSLSSISSDDSYFGQSPQKNTNIFKPISSPSSFTTSSSSTETYGLSPETVIQSIASSSDDSSIELSPLTDWGVLKTEEIELKNKTKQIIHDKPRIETVGPIKHELFVDESQEENPWIALKSRCDKAAETLILAARKKPRPENNTNTGSTRQKDSNGMEPSIERKKYKPENSITTNMEIEKESSTQKTKNKPDDNITTNVIMEKNTEVEEPSKKKYKPDINANMERKVEFKKHESSTLENIDMSKDNLSDGQSQVNIVPIKKLALEIKKSIELETIPAELKNFEKPNAKKRKTLDVDDIYSDLIEPDLKKFRPFDQNNYCLLPSSSHNSSKIVVPTTLTKLPGNTISSPSHGGTHIPDTMQDLNIDLTIERIQNRNTVPPPRKTIQLDYAPGFRAGSNLPISRPLVSRPVNETITKCTKSTHDESYQQNGFVNSLNKTDSMKGLGYKEDEGKHEKNVCKVQPSAGSIKNISNRVNEGLTNSGHNNPMPVNYQTGVPPVNPSESAKMPLSKIIKGMNRTDSKVEESRPLPVPNSKPERPKLNPDFYRTQMQKPEYRQHTNSHGTYRPPNVVAPSAPSTETSGSHVEVLTGSVPPDQVYRDILQWNPAWLKEQNAIKAAPPVTGGRKLVTNLPGFLDYESYISTFYPLMLLELWASISQEFNRPGRHRHHERSSGKCTFQVAIEKVEIKDYCPMLPPLEKTDRRKMLVTNASIPFWHCIKLMTLSETKDLNKANDLGVLTVDILRGGENRRRQVFGFFLTESELYEELNHKTTDQFKLFPECSGKRYKYSVTFVTHLAEHQDIIRMNLGTIQRFAYISPKLRDFRAISLLPHSKLFTKVIHPISPEANDIYQPSNTVRVAGLVKDVVDLLNPIQRGIVHYISNRLLTRDDSELLLIHGPPGTGKTRTIVGLVLQLLKANQNKSGTKQKLLICTPSNTAIDEIIRRLITFLGDNFQLVRIGSGGCMDIKEFHLDELSRKYCAGASQLGSIREAIRTTELKIENLQEKIDDLGPVPDGTIAGAYQCEIDDLKNKKKKYLADLDRTRNNKKAFEKAKIDILLRADIVCSTLSSCCNSFVRKHLGPPKTKRGAPSVFTCCIIDEATQTTEPESLSPLMLNCDKLIIVGDPMQLPATVLSSEAESRDFGQSLFTRLFNFYSSQNINPIMMLTQQYRMNPEILHWPNLRFYRNKLITSSLVDSDPRRKLKLEPYLFFNINSQEVNENRQFSNAGEIKLIKEILLTIKRQSINPNHTNLTIGIITPYNDQRIKLLKLLDEFKEIDRNEGSGINFSNSIEVDTVDSFQGREKDIVLLSCVRTEELGFLKTPQRLNVSLTRAKMCLYIIGNAACLNGNEMWKSLMDDAVRRGVYKSIPDDDPTYPNKYKDVVEGCLIVSTTILNKN